MQTMKATTYLTTLALVAIIQSAYAQFDRDDLRVKDFNISYFDNNLQYVRGVMVERDERAIAAASHQILDKTLHQFLQTEFMLRFRELRLEAESLAATFKALSYNLPPREVARVRKAYTEIADAFNLQLVEIKRDFLDRKKMKMIRFNQEMYSNSLQYRLRELKDLFAHDFERVIAEVTGSEVYAAIPLAAILSMVKLAQDFTEYLINASYEARRVKEEHLNLHLLEPFRFRSWVEIEMIEGNMYFNANERNDQFDYQEEYPDLDYPFDDDNPASLKPKHNRW